MLCDENLVIRCKYFADFLIDKIHHAVQSMHTSRPLEITIAQQLCEINTEYARQGFFYMGAKLDNNLPASVRTAANGKDFKEKLDIFLKMK